MLMYTVRRLLLLPPVLLAAAVFVFVAVDVTGDPVAELRLTSPEISEEALQAEAERLYLDRSMPERFWLWTTGIGGDGDIGLLRGEFGPSTRGTAFDISEQVSQRLGVTVRLVVAALSLAIGLAILFGVVSALRQYSALDYGLTLVAFVALAMPTFWIGLLFQQAGVWLNDLMGRTIFYTVGATSADTRGFTAWQAVLDAGAHLILPTLALMLTGFAQLSRYQRASMLEVLNSDYVRLARAKGLRNRVVVRRHALRTALIPVTTLSLLLIAGAIDGVVLIETVFQWRGLGTFFVESVADNDTYAVMGWLMLSGIVVIVGNLIADLLYAVLDPRIRYD